MSIEITSWNVEARLGKDQADDVRSQKVIRSLSLLPPQDIIILPEAYVAEEGISPQVEGMFQSNGYAEMAEVAYDDAGPDREHGSNSQQVFRVMSRRALLDVEIIRPAGLRNLLHVVSEDPQTRLPVHVYGVHLDDRSKDMRIAQIIDLGENIAQHPEDPIILAGDFNASSGNGVMRRLNTPFMHQVALKANKSLAGSVLQRGLDMLSGDELRLLESYAGVFNADSSNQPTVTPRQRGLEFLPALRLIDIDHILRDQKTTVTAFSVMKHDGGADHRAIHATLDFEQHLKN